MRPPLFWTVGLLALLVACTPPKPLTPAPESTRATTGGESTTLPPVGGIRGGSITFALIGDVNLSNVWATYDEPGVDYNNRAAQAGFWPSLYRLNAQTGEFESYLADGNPTAFKQEGDTFTATVTLRAGLVWSDGSPVSAKDVAFSVNTALTFRLGLDWAAAYNPNILLRAEASGAKTIKFIFNSQPTIPDWQYGALQGPIVSAAYWSPKIESAQAVLKPQLEIESAMLDMQTERARLQREQDDLLQQLSTLAFGTLEFNNVQTEINKRQDDINSIGAHLEEKQNQLDAVFAAGRAALYALSAEDEPTFGPFKPDEIKTNQIVNVLNSAYPFSTPYFDRAVYKIFPNRSVAFNALKNGQVNLVLAVASDGAIPPEGGGQTLSIHGAGNLRYLAFNLNNPDLSQLVLRQVLACIAWDGAESFLLAADGIVPRANIYWRNTHVSVPCRDARDERERLARAAAMLADAGYRWDVNPAWDGAPVPGLVLRRADGRAVSQLRFLVYESESDAYRVEWAESLAEKIRHLGIPVALEHVNAQDVLYRVYDTHDFDMLILGLRLARYPAYLCDVFGPGNIFGYETPELTGHCALLRNATDLEAARAESAALQLLLANDLPIVPLYTDAVYDSYTGIAFPFNNVLDGFAGLYGAPWLAYPTIP